MGNSTQGLPNLTSCCNRLAHAVLPSDYAILKEAGLATGHPWAFLADTALSDPGSVAYYRYLYGLGRLLNPVHVLEIGTAFGLGSAALLQGSPGLRKLISLDLGVFTQQYEIVKQSAGLGWPVMERYREEHLVSDGRNVEFAREALGRLAARLRPEAQVRLYRVNTQREGTDNFDVCVDVPRWFDVPELVAELESTPIDLLFIDGKHTGDGLFQDFNSFFRFVRPGGVVLCDDVHDSSYPYAWAGQTLASFQRATAEFADEIEESTIWPFPQLPDGYGQEPVARPFGLVRKRGGGARSALPSSETAFVSSELEEPSLSFPPPPTPAQAYWRQRHALQEAHDRLVALEQAVDDARDLSPPQWAQLLALALEFRPTLIVELGRELGNATCVFTEAANRLPPGSCRVLSLCLTDYWDARTVPRLRKIVPADWFSPLQPALANILTWDYRSLVRADDRVLVFWDAHGFEVAECVLGAILPLLADKPHVLAMHDLSDARYLSPEQDDYQGRRIWMGPSSMGSGSRVRLGHVNSEVPQAVAIVDFCSRNRITLESADHSFHTEIGRDTTRVEELRRILGERHFSLAGHWFWLSLNERPGPYTFPAFTPPVVRAPKRLGLARRLWIRLRGR